MLQEARSPSSGIEPLRGWISGRGELNRFRATRIRASFWSGLFIVETEVLRRSQPLLCISFIAARLPAASSAGYEDAEDRAERGRSRYSLRFGVVVSRPLSLFLGPVVRGQRAVRSSALIRLVKV